jgi:HicB family
LIDALTQVALEVSSQLPNGHLDVRLAGQDPELVYVEEEGEEPQAQGTEDGLTARVSLRLPESLKVALEKAADAEGVSLNTWLVRALQRAASGGGGRAIRSGKRITGYAQS